MDERPPLATPPAQLAACAGAGYVIAVGVEALSQLTPGFAHQHGDSILANAIAPLAHESLFAAPAIVLLAILARETRGPRVALGLIVTLGSLAATNALLLPQ